MMKSILAIAILCTTAHAQSMVITSRGSFGFHGTERQVEQIRNPIVARPIRTAQQEDYFVVFKSFGCEPCARFERTEQPRLEALGYAVRVVDLDRSPQYRTKGIFPAVTRTPTIWKVSRKDRKKLLRSWQGYQTTETLTARVVEKIKVFPILNQRQPRMSQSDMISLHNRLHGGGSWTWPGNLRQHLQTVHGQRIQ